MINQVREFIDKHSMLDKNNTVIVGVSGGADSVGLLLLLKNLSAEYDIQIVAAHINHNLRGSESMRDQEFVISLCKEFNLPCIVKSVDVLKKAKEQKKSIELAARELRYSVLEELAALYGTAKIATGHHIDDNVETGIMNFARGTGILGLSGIAPAQGNVIRPLLCVTKEQILAYLRLNNQSFVEDSSNHDNVYTRNKVRNKVIPILMDEVNTKANLHINDTQQDLRELYSFLEEKIIEVEDKLVERRGKCLYICQEEFEKQAKVIQTGIIKKSIEKIAQTGVNIQRNHVAAVINLLQMQVGRKINLPHNIMVYREYGGLRLEQGVDKSIIELHQESISLEIPGKTILNSGKVIEIEILEYNNLKNVEENHYTKYFDYDIIKGALYADKVKRDDVILINTQGNKQSFAKYCKNNKIPGSQRDNIWAIKNDNQILWVLEYRKSMIAQVTDESKKIIKIQIGG